MYIEGRKLPTYSPGMDAKADNSIINLIPRPLSQPGNGATNVSVSFPGPYPSLGMRPKMYQSHSQASAPSLEMGLTVSLVLSPSFLDWQGVPHRENTMYLTPLSRVSETVLASHVSDTVCN